MHVDCWVSFHESSFLNKQRNFHLCWTCVGIKYHSLGLTCVRCVLKSEAYLTQIELNCYLFSLNVFSSSISYSVFYIWILLVCLSVSLSVCLYPINVKTAEPIGPKFVVGHHVTPGKVYGWSNFQKCASIKIRFLKILKIYEMFFIKSAKFFVLVSLTKGTFMSFVNKENPPCLQMK